MAPKPPGCSDRPGKAVALLGITLHGAPDMAPKPPGCSDRPGKAVALLGITLHGAPDMAPKPPGCSDRPGKAVALLGITLHGAPEMAPKPPGARIAPAKPWRSSASRSMGPRHGPQAPRVLGSPRQGRGAPRHHAPWGPRHGPQAPALLVITGAPAHRAESPQAVDERRQRRALRDHDQGAEQAENRDDRQQPEFLALTRESPSSRAKSFIVAPLSSEFYLRASADSTRPHREDIGAGQLGAPIEQMPRLGEQRVRLSGRATRQDEQPGQHGKQESPAARRLDRGAQ